MSSGITHAKASVILTGAFAVASLVSLDFSNLEYCIGSIMGIFITPDMDVDAGYNTDKIIRNKIGRWAEYIWDFILNPYRRIAKHGSFLSHFPIVGTLGRIVYFYLILIVIPHLIIYFAFNPSWDLGSVLRWYWVIIWERPKIIMGLMSADTVHFGLDILTTEHAKDKK